MLAGLWRQKILFVLVVAAVLVATVGALVVLPVRYLATGTVIVAEPDPGVADPSALRTQNAGDPADLESQLMILRSPRLVKLALEQPGALDALKRECRSSRSLFSSSRNCDGLTSDDPQLIDRVGGLYSIGTAGRSRVINIAYQSNLPDVAQALANALIAAFLADQRDGMSSGREEAAKWMWQELARLDSDIRAQDTQIEDYRRQKGLMRGATAPIASEQLTSIGQQLAAAQQNKAQAAARLKEIREGQSGGASSATSVLDNRSIADLKQQIAAARRQLAATTTIFGPRHPQLRVQQDALDALQQQLSVETRKVSESAQKDFDAASSLVNSLQSQMKTATDEAGKAASNEASIEGMVRGVAIKRQQYAELYQRASALETERRSLIGSTRLISLAELPLKPVFPKKVPFLAIGLVLGLILGAVAALLRDKFAGRPSSVPLAPQEPETLVASNTPTAPRRPPAIIELPALKPGSLLDSATMSLPSALWKASAARDMQLALDDLLSELQEHGLGDSVKRILVTSARVGQGKTFTTIALARAAARAGMKVLAIECASARGDFEEAFVFDSEGGLSDILNDRVDPASIVQSGTIEGFHLLPSGHQPMSFVGTASRRKMSALLEWARGYDLVLLDGPCLGDEATALAALVDGLLICTNGDEPFREDGFAGGLLGHPLAIVVTAARPAEVQRPTVSLSRSRIA
jgi:uncharacterized protein involved in exopolysaccharide biosynthesis/Mrp family chromosome partitioning ATPase